MDGRLDDRLCKGGMAGSTTGCRPIGVDELQVMARPGEVEGLKAPSRVGGYSGGGGGG